MLGFSYSSFEGLQTPWNRLNRWLCKHYGHPDRRYMVICPGKIRALLCARCMEVINSYPLD
jgi:hypothetical protein